MPYTTMKQPKKQKNWTHAELVVIRDNYLNMSDEELSALLPGRTPDAINHRRAKQGFSR